MASSPARVADGLEAAVSGVVAALDRLAATATAGEDDEVLAAAVAELDRCGRRLEGQSLRLLAEVSERDLPNRSGLGNLGAWLRQQLPTTDRREVSRRAAQAEALFGLDELAGTVDLTPTREAVLSGDLPTGSAVHITQALSRLVPPATPAGLVDEATLAEAQQALTGQATQHDPAVVRAMAERLVATLDPRAGERLARDEERQADVRALTLVRDATGMYLLKGQLTPVCGAALMAALDAWSAPRPAADGTAD